MKRIGIPLTLALHLLLLLAFQHSSRHAMAPPARNSEVAMLWIAPPKPASLRPAPVRAPSTPSARPPVQAPSPTQAAPEKTAAMTIVTAPPAPAPALLDAAPRPETRPVLADPAALVRGMHFDDEKSDLRRSIEAHGGTISSVKKEKYAAFQDAVEAATIPDCIGGDGGKHPQGQAGGGSVGGLLALPLLVGAKLTGHCK